MPLYHLLHHCVSSPPRAIPLVLLSGSLLLRLWLAVSPAQVTTALTPDGTLGTTVTRNGNVYAITGGTRPGNGPNLFHSFDRFNVGTGNTASFTGPPTGITNILSRVTGGQRSDIDGQLRSEIPGANLYLLNPAGVLFGPHASLDVSGSFHVSTADYLRLADGARFYARLSDTSTLSAAPPAAFGFLGPTPAALTVQGSSLQVPVGATLSVVSGDIRITGQGPLTNNRIPTLGAPSGQIQLASVAAAGEVPVNLQDFQRNTVARLGRMEFSQGALLDTSGNGGGTVRIRSGRLLVDGSAIFADNQGSREGTGLGVDLEIMEDAIITNGARITTDSLGTGRARDLRLTAGQVHLEQGAQIRSGTFGSGQGGAVQVTATETLTFASDSEISADALGTEAGAGNAGSVEVHAPRITLTDGAQISSGTFGPGQGGTVRVTATETLTLAGPGQDVVHSTGIFANALGTEAGAGNAGSIEVHAPRITLTDGALIGSGTLGPGQGGAVRVRATETLMLSGSRPLQEGTIPSEIFPSVLPLQESTIPSAIFASTLGTGAGAGNAGVVVVEAGSVRIADGAQINSETRGPGHGGAVMVTTADTLTIAGRNSGLRTAATRSGTGGDIAVQAQQVQLTAGAAISTEASQADGGNIHLTALGMLRLHDSHITATVGGGRQTVGGNITIDSQFVLLQKGQIVANAFEGQGGNIRITAGVLLADPASRIDASSQRGINGQVNIQAPVTSISGTVASLPQAFAQTAELLRNRCAARLHEGTVSSLVERGRDGVPASPEGLLPSRLAGMPPGAATPGTAGQRRRKAPVAHQGGLQRDANGQLQIKDWPTLAASAQGQEVECAAR